jgi:hypothetical protein
MTATIFSSLLVLLQLSYVIVANACLLARGNFCGGNPEHDESMLKVTGVK